MTMVACDRNISKETGQLLLIKFKFIWLYQPEYGQTKIVRDYDQEIAQSQTAVKQI